jgi:hypothetical protein
MSSDFMIGMAKPLKLKIAQKRAIFNCLVRFLEIEHSQKKLIHHRVLIDSLAPHEKKWKSF